MWTYILLASSAGLAVLSLILALFAVRIAVRAQAWPAASEAYAKSQLQSLRDSIKEQAEALETLANRYKMQKVRNVIEHGRGSQGEPDARRDPEGWRAWKNHQLRSGSSN